MPKGNKPKTAEFFVEILSEEIPARMQKNAEEHFRQAIGDALRNAGLGTLIKMKSWSTPRRLAISVKNIRIKQDDMDEEKRGPRSDAPDSAIKGFLKSAGIGRDEAEIRTIPKGEFYFAVIKQKGRPAKEILPSLLADVLLNFKWRKSMRWAGSHQRWVRPIRGIYAVFDGKPLKGLVDFGGGVEIPFGNKTLGHRLMPQVEIPLKSGENYEDLLKKHGVIVDRQKRVNMIGEAIDTLVNEHGFEKRDNKSLWEEVAGLVEYPHAVMGKIDVDFMTLTQEILVAVMSRHQKYFSVRTTEDELAPHFITIADRPPNLPNRDDVISKGNERVLRARLADAKFFWEQDCQTSLNAYATKDRLSGMVFFDGLGTMWDRSCRLKKLAGQIARMLGGNKDMIAQAKRAGELAKADLLSQTVGEFPELQGIVGGHLARKQGETEDVVEAIGGHYEGVFLTHYTTVSIVLALADRIDTLVGFFHIGIIPTGSKDPYALRRAAFSLLALIIENKTPFNVDVMLRASAKIYGDDWGVSDTLKPFLQDRFKTLLRDHTDIHHEIVSAVINANDTRWGEFYHHYAIAKELAGLLKTDDGKAVLAAYRRAVNILKAEERKDKTSYSRPPNPDLFAELAEEMLFNIIARAEAAYDSDTDKMVRQLKRLGTLRKPIDRFFENVMVNHADERIRQNRLKLLNMVRTLMDKFADFSAIEG